MSALIGGASAAYSIRFSKIKRTDISFTWALWKSLSLDHPIKWVWNLEYGRLLLDVCSLSVYLLNIIYVNFYWMYQQGECQLLDSYLLIPYLEILRKAKQNLLFWRSKWGWKYLNNLTKVKLQCKMYRDWDGNVGTIISLFSKIYV